MWSGHSMHSRELSLLPSLAAPVQLMVNCWCIHDTAACSLYFIVLFLSIYLYIECLVLYYRQFCCSNSWARKLSHPSLNECDCKYTNSQQSHNSFLWDMVIASLHHCPLQVHYHSFISQHYFLCISVIFFSSHPKSPCKSESCQDVAESICQASNGAGDHSHHTLQTEAAMAPTAQLQRQLVNLQAQYLWTITSRTSCWQQYSSQKVQDRKNLRCHVW